MKKNGEKMPSITIAPYTLRVKRSDQARKRASKDTYIIFNELGDRNKIKECVLKFLQDSQNKLKKDQTSILKVHHLNETDSIITGVIQFGECDGSTEEGINIKTGEQTYKKTPEDAGVIPYYFLMYLPDDKNTGVIMMQRHGVKGIYKCLSKELKELFKEQFPNHKFYLNPLVPGKLIKDISDNIKEINIISYDIPSDLGERYFNRIGFEPHETKLVISVKPKRNKLLREPDLIKNVRKGKINVTEIRQELGYLPEKIQVSFDYNGKIRKMDILADRKITHYFDITDDIELDQGHPIFSSIDKYCKVFLNDLLYELGLITPP